MWKTYVFFIVLSEAVGVLSGLLTRGGMDAYQLVNKPALTPPDFLFPIVWSILYVLMGVSSYLVRDNKELMIIYIINLIVNYAWSFIFFNLEFRVFAFFWILLLLGIVIYMAYRFYKENKLAGYLLIPYILWLIFAAFLNLSIII